MKNNHNTVSGGVVHYKVLLTPGPTLDQQTSYYAGFEIVVDDPGKKSKPKKKTTQIYRVGYNMHQR